jgi:nucleoside-diphosphate-sugar epimerase
MKVLVTGSEGLVGAAVTRALRKAGIEVVPFDKRNSDTQDLCCSSALAAALSGVDGVVHLAAVSRVIAAERNPRLCRQINEKAFAELVTLCEAKRTWLLFASSREVYGQQDQLPVFETAPLRPINAYARSKVFGERLVVRARKAGITANVVRLSNVYGSTRDHADRVVPAFAHAAAAGGTIRLEGRSTTFDFTHISDVAQGLFRMIELTAAGRNIDPIHLTTGVGTTLAELAGIAASNARGPLKFEDHPSRDFDVSSFVGSTVRAAQVLDWSARINLNEGFAQLAEEFAAPSAILRKLACTVTM